MSAGYLLDTHIWLWYLNSSRRLPTTMRRRIERNVASCWLSPISVWEVALLVRRDRERLVDETLTAWVARAHAELPLREAPVTREIAIAADGAVPHRDPADAFIVATARTHDLTLMTLDATLLGLPRLRAIDH